MCDFLSAIATRDGRLLFCEDDSHETIVRRAGLRDGDLHLRHWVRVEQRPGDAALRVDEASTPGWWDAEEWQPRLDALLARVSPVRAAYDEARRPVHAAYAEATRTAQAAYDEAMRPARAAYAEATRPARAAYDEAMRPVHAAYDEAMRTAAAAYAEAMRTADAAYDEARRPAQAVYVAALAPIEGYCPARGAAGR